MMRELIERLRYCFAFWRREQREDLFGAGGASALEDSSGLEDSRDNSYYNHPRNAAIIAASGTRFAVNVAIVFFGGIAIFGLISTVLLRPFGHRPAMQPILLWSYFLAFGVSATASQY